MISKGGECKDLIVASPLPSSFSWLHSASGYDGLHCALINKLVLPDQFMDQGTVEDILLDCVCVCVRVCVCMCVCDGNCSSAYMQSRGQGGGRGQGTGCARLPALCCACVCACGRLRLP